MNLSDEMKVSARSIGLCDQWFGEWKDNSSKDELIEKFIKGIDFCIEHNFPTPKIMKERFGDRTKLHNVFVDDIASIKNARTVVINGDSNVSIDYDYICVGDIYIRHGSKCHIKASGDSKVFISVYDNAILEVEQSENAKVFVYLHGGDCKPKGNVKIHDRRK